MSAATERYVVASQRPWNAGLAARLAARTGRDFRAVSRPSELDGTALAAAPPRYIFFPHWSDKIPAEVWQWYECVIFHMTDVPYGRGGSPLQNLIVRGHRSTVVSALRCVELFDAGPVYLRRPLSLAGTAEEIFTRADSVIEEMIVEIVETNPEPVPQVGEPTVFKRRRPEDSNLASAATLDEWFDRIRMLDADGYPHAYLDVGRFRLEFRKAVSGDDRIEAAVTVRALDKEANP